jgi:hypothetical protein
MFDSTFWILAAVAGGGLAVFGLAMLLDGLLELGDFPATHALGLFAAGGAATAMIIRGAGVVSLTVAIIGGVVVGVLLVIILSNLISAAKRSEHEGRVVNFDELIGSEAAIVWWSTNHGEVLVDVSGQRVKVDAVAAESIPKDTRMEVAAFERVGDQLVKVTVKARN